MYTHEFQVRYSEIDSTGCLSMTGLLRMLQDTGYAHAEARNMGIARTIPEGKTWYLISWDIRAERMPRVGEQIFVDTWFYFLAGSVAKKNLVIRDARNHILAAADTRWVYMHVGLQVPIEAPKNQWPKEDFGEAYAGFRERVKRIPSIDGTVSGAEKLPITAIRPCHLDTNGHANNTKLTEFAMELAGADCDTGLRGIRAEYLRQVHLEDVLQPYVMQDGGRTCISLWNQAGEEMTRFAFSSLAEARGE